MPPVTRSRKHTPRPTTKADQVRMAGDVATMFDDLRAVAGKHAELHAARARLQADVDRLDREHRAGLERSWWRLHRLLGQ
jgi:hypothetical protein